jgi:hypothetical protein
VARRLRLKAPPALEAVAPAHEPAEEEADNAALAVAAADSAPADNARPQLQRDRHLAWPMASRT